MGQGIQVQAQTHNKLQNVDDGSGNPSTSTDTQQTVQNVDDGSGNPSTSTDTQQTTKCRRWVRESKYKHRHTTNYKM